MSWLCFPCWRLPATALLLAALLAGCVSRPPVSPVIERLPAQVELRDVPFIPDARYQGAPAALAALLVRRQLEGDPEQLARQLRLPAEEARLQANLVALAQSQGLLVTTLQPNLTALLHQLAAGSPVLLRLDSGYALLTGYDRERGVLRLNSGDQQLELDFASFQRGWSAAGQWAVLLLLPSDLLPPAAIPVKPDAAAAREAAANSSQALMALHKRWLKATGAARDGLRRQMVEQASQRRALLVQLVQEQPNAVLQALIPDDQQTGMPPEVLARLEQRLDLDGQLDVLYEDYLDGSSKLRHQLTTAFGERFDLHFGNRRQDWRSGLAVNAQGWLLLSDDPQQGAVQGDLLLADDEQGLILYAGADGSDGGSDLAYAMPNTLGPQRTLVILVNFQDLPNDKPWTVSQVSSTVLGGVSDYYKENSLQQTWLTGNVAGWYTLPLSSTVCDGFAIERYAKEAAQAGGFNLTQYDRFVYIFPKNACGYAGMAQVGAFPSSAWIHNSMILHTIAHEMGHNLGLQHAHALDCGDTTLGSSCVSQTYGDTLDVMGYFGTVGHFNGFNKERLGWLGGSNIATASSSGSYTLQPASATTSAAKVLKVPRGVDASGNPTYYYVELRKPEGFDAQLPDRGVIDPNNVFSGIVVRQATPNDGNSGYLLDMTPGSNYVDMKDPAILAGRNFTDSAAGVSITAEWTDANQALVSVDLAGGQAVPCTRAAPAIVVSPSQSAWLVAGSSYSFSVSVTNKDSSSCASSSIGLSTGKPSGWSASQPGSVTLAPGASSSVSLQVTSPSSASDGFYGVSSTATASAGSATASATYVVDNPDAPSNTPPVANADSVVLSSVSAVSIAVLANDSDPDGDKLSVSSFTQGGKGTVRLNSDGSLTYSPAKSFKGSDQFSYSISDGQATASASVSISLQSSGGGGGGKGRP